MHAPSAPHLRPTRPIPRSGALSLRVRYCECDPMGLAHHAAYIPWLEMGRTELLRDAGISYAQLEEAGVFLVIVKLECAYRRPAYYDDMLDVRTAVVGSSRVKLRHEYRVFCADPSAAGPAGRTADLHTPILTASTTLACVDRAGRPAMLPEWLISASPPEDHTLT